MNDDSVMVVTGSGVGGATVSNELAQIDWPLTLEELTPHYDKTEVKMDASGRCHCTVEPLLSVAALCSYNTRVFTWDEAKRKENLKKYGIDFADPKTIFAGYTATAEDSRKSYGEQRFLTLGLLQGVVVSVAHTPMRNDDRIISIRKATRHETRFYFSQIPD